MQVLPLPDAEGEQQYGSPDEQEFYCGMGQYLDTKMLPVGKVYVRTIWWLIPGGDGVGGGGGGGWPPGTAITPVMAKATRVMILVSCIFAV